MKIALGQINPTVGDFSGNAAKIIDFARRAQSQSAGLILFPELSVCGYPPRDLLEKPAFVAKNQEVTQQIARAVPGISIVCGLVTPAKVETGIIVQVPPFIGEGETIRVDTTAGKYLERASK